MQIYVSVADPHVKQMWDGEVRIGYTVANVGDTAPVDDPRNDQINWALAGTVPDIKHIRYHRLIDRGVAEAVARRISGYLIGD